MIQPIDNFQTMMALKGYQGAERVQSRQEQVAKKEFLAIFYKELLRQSFQPAKSAWGGLAGENNNSALTAFGNDIMLEKMAQHLASSNQAFSPDQLFSTQAGALKIK